MVAYLHKIRGGKFELTICNKPCNGEEFNKAQKFIVYSKYEANRVATAHNAKPHNF